ncbi:MAG: hypothetical protein QOG15_683 [Solirubrobacteraceae bacterium]|jgi:hypothetical protein|nr:hypothetical protein [Solirubrobacteraceae bacterium]
MTRTGSLVATGAAALLVTLALSSSARAATAAVIDVKEPIESDPGAFDVRKTPALIGSPGEANRITVSEQATSATVFYEDLGAVITVGTGCTSIDAHHASCANAESSNPIVNAGDGDDTVNSTPSISLSADGGLGADVLVGSTTGDALNGGGGLGDVVIGGGGDDTLSDGDGVGGTPIDADRLDGGGGKDTISYEGRTTPVIVDLGSVLQAGEGNQLTSFESVTGGGGADHITGTAANNLLGGGGGDDVVAGGKGVDYIYGGKGNDRIDAAAGNDRVFPEEGNDRVSLGSGNDRMDESYDEGQTGDDRVGCGAGHDEILAIQDTSIDRLAADCERFNATETAADGNVVFNGLGVTVKLRGVRRSGSVVLVPLTCDRTKGDKPCVVSGELRASNGAKLGGPLARLKVQSRATKTLRLVLTSKGRARVRRGAKVRLKIAERGKGFPGFERLKRARSQAQIVVH